MRRKPIVRVELSRCPYCGSNARSGYVHTESVPLDDGRVHRMRDTTCLVCKESRIDSVVEDPPFENGVPFDQFRDIRGFDLPDSKNS